MSEQFRHYIAGWVRKYGTAQRLATEIGLSLSAFSRGVRNAGTLGVESLLRLAVVTGDPPGHVLRLAGKGDVAELVEQLYGHAPPAQPLTGPQRDLIKLWDTLTDEERVPLLVIMRGLTAGRTRHRRQQRA